MFGERKEIIIKLIYSQPGLTREDIHRITGINKGTVRNYLVKLCKKGILVNKDNKYYPRKNTTMFIT